ncbi:COG4626 Phage terminase-like protein, large subunit [uncultured Caudovirales phage]|uniref:COG4626 Phage terminase-like protein, large subunit n=1 Tax=uncultured Caudovirales phage TaxID=2100421 RepID=A0A6J5PZL0_9CAUD|nr:COG4626 Phage terminase-like protein, large subunit [uncultured Caudovirales phage]CAB4199221.1 COG4626 Phage terminase-like protein, large subunit [uncultured Caudovirales phage]CAB4213035.1 COG4626 Phage terminase-like protein, large subunit [uncultured Caudovirales phage]CAB5227942.1 COG4626 Phage terminase-like protein, large subunit [uncultured Caudovirales phage]
MAVRRGTPKRPSAAGPPLPPTDPVTQFARDVVEGRKFVVAHNVLLACQRHLDDLQHGPARGLVWQPAEAQLAIEFFEGVLCLPEESDGDDDDDQVDGPPVDGQPFILSPWQQFIVGSLLGWWRKKGSKLKLRLRFRTAYIETGKGSGKTPMCAGLLIYFAIRFGQKAAQIFIAAATREQAKIGFADCESMVKASPFLRDVFYATVNNLSIRETGTFIRAISSEKRALDGKRVSAAMLDELHEQRAIVVNKIRKGIKGRPNALILEPTNAGFDRASICWQHHDYSRRVLERAITPDASDEWFAFVCALDPCAACRSKGREFPDEECPHCDDWKTRGPHWQKPNPNIGVSIPWDYVEGFVKEALGIPEQVNDLLRFNFGIWTQSIDRAFDMAKWQECAALPVPSDEELADYPCYGGLDLGQTDDLASFALLWDLGESLVAKAWFWLPEAAKEKYPDRPYAAWERLRQDGHPILTVTPGSTTDEETIEMFVLEAARKHGVLEIGFDKRFANRMAQNLMGEDITMVDTPQGFWLNESIRRVSKLVGDRKFAHGGNPILAHQAGVAVLRKGPNNTVRLDKESSKDKIDGLSAVTIGLSRIIAEPPDDDEAPELVTA